MKTSATGNGGRGVPADWKAIAAGLLTPALIVVLLWDTIARVEWTSLTHDQQIYAAVGGLWGRGFLPYRDAYDFKGPVIYAAMRVGFWGWGFHADAYRKVLVIVAALAALAAYGGLVRAGRFLAASVTSLAFLTLLVMNPFHLHWDTEPAAITFALMAAGFAFAARGRFSSVAALASGVCVGLAGLSKQPAFGYGGALLLQLLWNDDEAFVRLHRGRRLDVTRPLFMLAGIFLALGVVAAYFAWRGGLRAFYEAFIVDAWHFSRALELQRRWFHFVGAPRFLLDSARNGSLWPFTMAVLLLLPLALYRRSYAAFVALVWLAVSWCAVIIGPDGHSHYLLFFMPGLAICTGLVVELSAGEVAARGARARRLVGGLLFACLAFGPYWMQGGFPGRHPLPLRHRSEDDFLPLAEQVRQAARPGDTLFVGFASCWLHALTGLPAPTRVLYATGPNPDLRSFPGPDWRPTFVYLPANEVDLMRNGRSEHLLHVLVRREYCEWWSAEIGSLFRERSSGACPPA
jgi:hypothetical protein